MRKLLRLAIDCRDPVYYQFAKTCSQGNPQIKFRQPLLRSSIVHRLNRTTREKKCRQHIKFSLAGSSLHPGFQRDTGGLFLDLHLNIKLPISTLTDHFILAISPQYQKVPVSIEVGQREREREQESERARERERDPVKRRH